VFVSAASAWEIATKSRIGKLPQAADLALRFDAILLQESFESLPITSEHAARAGLLPGPHKDPFDRMLIAQSLAENLPISATTRSLTPTNFGGSGIDFLIAAACAVSTNTELRANKRLDPFFSRQAQAQQFSLAFQVDMKIKERAAFALRRHPFR